MSELSKAARISRNEATAAMLRGGTIRVYGGAPASADDPIGERPELVRVEVPDSRLAVRAEQGAVIARGMRKVMVEREGLPTFWRAYSRDGSCVTSGPAIVGEQAKAIAKSDGAVTPSAMVIEVDKLWRGMEFELPELKIVFGGPR